uniref:Mitochondrial carrier protein n=1 Tax=Globisporangium ultimum (strain ATCC 200006 / CBS 805.95 / DAOM BR144) TaxID=431595 RepID=K3X8A2_GLOUD
MTLQQMRGLYRGVGVNLIGSAPAMTLYLSTYEASRDALQQVEFFQQRPSLSYLSAGMAAQAVSCVLWVPIDVIKQRMQVQTQARAGANPSIYYRSTAHAMQMIAKTEGVRGFYKGFVASMVSFGPYSSLYFMLYEKNKAMAKAYLGAEHLPPQFTLAGAALASATASFLTNPLDLVKLRIQVQAHALNSGSESYIS